MKQVLIYFIVFFMGIMASIPLKAFLEPKEQVVKVNEDILLPSDDKSSDILHKDGVLKAGTLCKSRMSKGAYTYLDCSFMVSSSKLKEYTSK